MRVEGAPVFDEAAAGDEDQHEGGGGDEGEFGLEPEEKHQSDDEFDDGNEVGHGGDEEAGEKTVREVLFHPLHEAGELGQSHKTMEEEVGAQSDAGY